MCHEAPDRGSSPTGVGCSWGFVRGFRTITNLSGLELPEIRPACPTRGPVLSCPGGTNKAKPGLRAGQRSPQPFEPAHAVPPLSATESPKCPDSQNYFRTSKGFSLNRYTDVRLASDAKPNRRRRPGRKIQCTSSSVAPRHAVIRGSDSEERTRH